MLAVPDECREQMLYRMDRGVVHNRLCVRNVLRVRDAHTDVVCDDVAVNP